MATLGRLIANSLWFAFDALDYQKTGVVVKSQLKVLTQNIGVLLYINRRVENCIQDYLSIKQLNFDQFLYFLIREVFAEVDDGKKSYGRLKVYHDCLEETFWLLGRQCLGERHVPLFTESCVFKMFRIFCMLSDRTHGKGGLSQVTMSEGEVEEVARSLVLALGRDWDQQDFEHLAAMIPTFTLPVFLTFVEGRYAQDVEPPALVQAVDEIYGTFVEQILERGKVYQRLTWAPVWVCRDLEIVPWEIREMKYGTHYTGKVLGGPPFLPVKANVTLHSIPDEPSARACRLTVCFSKNRLLQLATTDHKSKTRWLHAISTAIQNSEDPLPYQYLLSEARKAGRAMEEEKETEEKIRRASQADIIEQTQAELVAEKIARAQAEASAREEAAARETEARRVQDLQLLQHQLEKLLDEEKQAKRDEEIVRNLQARVLREEWEKREELEMLQEEQRKVLETEKRKRQEFERQQEEKETRLREAENRLKALEADRVRLDRELRCAREKIVMSERSKELVEAKMKVKERTPPVRAYSFRPSRRERNKPSTVTRSSSFNTQTPTMTKLPPSDEELSCPIDDDDDATDEHSVTIHASKDEPEEMAASASDTVQELRDE